VVRSNDQSGYPHVVVASGSGSRSDFTATFGELLEIVIRTSCQTGRDQCVSCPEESSTKITLKSPSGHNFEIDFNAGVAGWVLTAVQFSAWTILAVLIRLGKVTLRVGGRRLGQETKKPDWKEEKATNSPPPTKSVEVKFDPAYPLPSVPLYEEVKEAEYTALEKPSPLTAPSTAPKRRAPAVPKE